METTTITHEELARRVADELRSTGTHVTDAEVLDALHLATDSMVTGIEVRG